MRRKVQGEKSLKVHRLIVEDILGKPLPKKAEVHHVDYNRANNSNNNLVVCPNRIYHCLLHSRQEVQNAGYNPNTHHKCTDCNDYYPFAMFSKNKTRTSGYNNLCKKCDNARNKERYHRRVA